MQDICLFLLKPIPCPSLALLFIIGPAPAVCFLGSLANWFPVRFGQQQENGGQEEGRSQGMSSWALLAVSFCFRLSVCQWLCLFSGSSSHLIVPSAVASVSSGGSGKAPQPFVPLAQRLIVAPFSLYFPCFLSSFFPFFFHSSD